MRSLLHFFTLCNWQQRPAWVCMCMRTCGHLNKCSCICICFWGSTNVFFQDRYQYLLFVRKLRSEILLLQHKKWNVGWPSTLSFYTHPLCHILGTNIWLKTIQITSCYFKFYFLILSYEFSVFCGGTDILFLLTFGKTGTVWFADSSKCHTV